MSLLKSFKHAFAGLGHCLTNERNMRIHIVIAGYILVFANFFQMSPVRWAVLLISIFLVILLEMVNTSIEKLCDLYSTQQNPKIKIIKDISAGAVLISALSAVIVGLVLFWNPPVFWDILMFFSENVWWFTFFILTIVFCVLFIVLGPKAMLGTKKKKQN